MSNQIEFEIVTRLDSVEKSLKSLESQSKNTGDKLDKNLGSGLGTSITKAFTPVRVAIAGVIASLATVGVVMSKAIKEASEDQAAIAKLNQSLAAAGTFSLEASLSIQAFADRLEETTTIAGSTTLGLVALSRNFTRTNEEATKLTEAAIELSAATGISLETAVEGLGKSLSGNAGRLAQQVPLIQNFTKEQLKAGAALDAVLQRFAGSEAAKVNTFEGAIARLNNLFGRLLTGIGNIVVQSPALTAAFKFIGDRLLNLIKSLDGFFASSGDLFGEFLSISASVGRVLNFAIIGPIELILTLINRTAQALGALGAVFVQVFTGEFQAAASTLKEGVLEAFNVETFEFAGTKAVDGFLTGFQNAVNNAPPLDVLPKNNTPGDQIAKNIDPLKNPALGISFKNLQTAFNQSATSIKLTAFDLATSLKQSFVTGFSNSFAAFGSALAKGENAFAAFGKSILSSLGQLLIQFGSTLVAIGLGLSTVPFLFGLQGPAAVAAGAAAIVLGGALTALGGAGGGGASAPAASSGGGVAGAGFQSPIGETATSFNETEPVEPGTQVAVNINGNVLGDKRTLGIAVAEAINEAFGSDGAIIARGALA